MDEAKIVYKLLDNGTGVILTRNPEIVKGKLSVCFEGAEKDALAVLKFDNGREIYRELDEHGACELTFDRQQGIIQVTAITIDGVCSPKRWHCESLKYEMLPDKSEKRQNYLVCPDDMNLPQIVTEIKLENEKIREENKKIHNRLDELETRLKNIMEGYDLV
jgi:hypothetical protein